MKVFLVDDSAPFRSALTALLSPTPGIDVTGYATDVDEAVGAILSTRPDVVIVDIRLGTGSGIAVIEAVKLLRPLTKCIVLSNHVSPGYRDRCARAGADSFFDKSADIERMVAHCARMATTLTPATGAP